MIRTRPCYHNIDKPILVLGLEYQDWALVLVFFLNPYPDRQSLGLDAAFFAPSYLLLALWTGYGLILLGTVLARPSANQSP